MVGICVEGMVQMYGTIGQELAKAAAYAQGRCCASTHQMAALSVWNSVMAAILKLWRQIENPTRSIDIYLKNDLAKFHPDKIWNNAALGTLKRSPHQDE